MIALLLAGLLGGAERPLALQPVLDKPYHVAVDEERADPSGVRHFHLDRTVVFSREAEGLVAAVTLTTVSTDAEGGIGRRFLIGASPLKGRTVRIHLDPNGSVRSIDDEAAIWSAVVAGVAAIAGGPKSGDPGGIARQPAAPLLALSPEARRSVLASVITSVIGESAPPGTRPVTLPPKGLLSPGAASMTGTETVTRQADGTLRSRVHAAAPVGGNQVSIDRTHVFDLAHGLLLATDDTQVITAAGATETIRAQVHVTPPVL